MKKTFICTLAAMLVVFSTVFTGYYSNALADTNDREMINRVCFEYDKNSQELYKIYDYSKKDELTIPAYINGQKVKVLNARDDLNPLKVYKKVTLEEGIEKIVDIPLAEEYVLPKSLTRISFWNLGRAGNLTTFPDVISYDSAEDDGKLYIEPNIRFFAELDDIISIDPHSEYYEYYLTEIITHSDNPYFKSVDGVLYSKDMKTLVRYPFANKRTEFKIPDGVEKIAPYAFSYCCFLKTVKVPDTVAEMGEGVFAFSKIKDVIVPDERFCERDISVTLNGELIDVNVYKNADGVIMIDTQDYDKLKLQEYTQDYTYSYKEIIDGKTYVRLYHELYYPDYKNVEAYSTEWPEKYYSAYWNDRTRTVVIEEISEKEARSGKTHWRKNG